MGYVWYKKGQELLGEIERSRLSDDLAAFWYIGQMGVVIKWRDTVFYVDPVLGDMKGEDGASRRRYKPPFSGGEAAADYIVCTHDHLDHIHPETIQAMAAKNPRAKICVPRPLAGRIRQLGIGEEQILGIGQGEDCCLEEGIRIKGIATAHESYRMDGHGWSETLGYVLCLGGLRLFHSGDSVATKRLLEEVRGEQVHVLMIPINGVDMERHERGIVGNMDCRSAAYFAQASGADLTIPLHYDMVMGNEENPLIFADYMERYYPERKYHLMRLGEKMIYG